MGVVYDIETGEMTTVPDPDPIPPVPSDFRLTKRQIVRAMILAGITDPDAFVTSAVSAIEDATEQALALTDWRYAPYYERTHPLFNDEALLTAVSMTPEQIDQIWMLGSKQPE